MSSWLRGMRMSRSELKWRMLMWLGCTLLVLGLSACSHNPVLVAAKCPPLPPLPPSLAQPPGNLDLVPPSLRPPSPLPSASSE